MKRSNVKPPKELTRVESIQQLRSAAYDHGEVVVCSHYNGHLWTQYTVTYQEEVFRGVVARVKAVYRVTSYDGQRSALSAIAADLNADAVLYYYVNR